MRRNRLALLFVLFITQAAFAVPLAITTLGVSTSTPTTATITWTTTGTSAAADTRVSYTGAGVTSAYIDGCSRYQSFRDIDRIAAWGGLHLHGEFAERDRDYCHGYGGNLQHCASQTRENSQRSRRLSIPSTPTVRSRPRGMTSARIGTTPTQCGAAITTPVSGTLDINGNLSVSLPDVNQVTPSVGAWTIAFSSFASTGSVSVDISPTGQNFDASATIQAQVTSGNKGPVGGSGGVGTGTVTSVTFTGDGVVDSSTPSTAVTTTGTVTGTIKTQTAHTFLGNNTGSTAAPAFAALALADLPGTVVNATSPGAGIAHFAGSTQTVTSSAVSLTADVSGILPTANGGTANAFFTVAGPASSAKTFTFPNASATIPQTIASGAKALATSAIPRLLVVRRRLTLRQGH
jgi:hypothetical protein